MGQNFTITQGSSNSLAKYKSVRVIILQSWLKLASQ